MQMLSEKERKYQREWRKKWRENPDNVKKQRLINNASRAKHAEKRREHDRKRDYSKQEAGRSEASKIKRRIRSNQRYHAKSERQKIADRARKYGMSIEQFDDMWAAQGGNCGSCMTILERDGGKDWFHIDHNHTTGKVRGILCGSCNRTIGHAQEFPARLRHCADYLERTNG